MRFQQELISLAEEGEITPKDTALIVLSKDGLKPLSYVGFESSHSLIKFLREHDIPFAIKGGRVHIGKRAVAGIKCKCGKCFGFPKCCCTTFLDSFHAASKTKPAFSSLEPYIFHVPCSPRCDRTQRLAQKYMFYIRERYPLVAEHLENGKLRNQ